MKIELLYFSGCPSWKDGLKNLESALHLEDIPAVIEIIKIRDDEQAARLKFLGSPSFRVNGIDLWHEDRDLYSMSCRIYSTPAGAKGFPTVDMLRGRLRNVIE